MAKVFLSHSSVDKPFVRKFDQALRAFEIDTFLDERDIPVGQDIPITLYMAIENASHFLYFISKNSLSSEWTQEELSAAKMREKSNKGIKVLPILIDDISPPLSIASKRYADFRKRRLDVRSSQFQLVLKALGNKEGKRISRYPSLPLNEKEKEHLSLLLLTTADLQIVLSDIVFFMTFSARADSSELLSRRLYNAKSEIAYRQIHSRFQALFEEIGNLNAMSQINPFKEEILRKSAEFIKSIDAFLSLRPESLPSKNWLSEAAESARYLQRRIGQLHFQLLVFYI